MATNLITAFTPDPTPQNNWTGAVGIWFTLTQPMTFNKIGAAWWGGATGPLKMAVLNADGAVVMAQATVNLAGGTVGEFFWADLPEVTLNAGVGYILWRETTSGDNFLWLNQSPCTVNDGDTWFSTYGYSVTDVTTWAKSINGDEWGGVDLDLYEVPASTWSTADADLNSFALTNNGLTVTPTGAAFWRCIRNTISKASGQWYVEFTVSALLSPYVMWGVASSGFDPTTLPGSDYSAGIYPEAQNFISSGFTSMYGCDLGDPDLNSVWALAVDFDAGSMWIAKDNVWAGSSDPATALSPIITFIPATVGPLFICLTLFQDTDTWTLQATAASQTYAPPSGFSAWDASGGAPGGATVDLVGDLAV